MATTEYGTYYLADNPSKYQPVRTNNFRVFVYGLEHLLRAGEDEENEDSYIEGASEVLEFSTESFSIPSFSQATIDVNRGNSQVHFAGKASFESGNSLQIYDFYSGDGKSVLYAWQRLSYDVLNDTIPSSTKYKKKMVILEYLPDNTLIRSWTLYGCWVSKVSESDISYGGGDQKKVTATIVYDRAVPEINKEG